eukprot:symbB.v1.2.008470.t1/scaffold534.1/size190675/1
MSELCDEESHGSLVGQDASGGLLALPPNSIGAVPMASLARRSAGSTLATAWLTVQVLAPGHPSPSAPFRVGAPVGPQIASSQGLHLAVQSGHPDGEESVPIYRWLNCPILVVLFRNAMLKGLDVISS